MPRFLPFLVLLPIIQAGVLQVNPWNLKSSTKILAECVPNLPVIPCISDSHCVLVPNSVCDLNTTPPPSLQEEEEAAIGTCQCLPETWTGCEECVPHPTTLEGSKCLQLSHCSKVAFQNDLDLVNCNPSTENPIPLYKTCTCSLVAVRHVAGDQCYPIVTVMGGLCHVDEQCEPGLGHAHCTPNPLAPSEKYCNCIGLSTGESYFNAALNKCLKYATQVHERCEDEPQCNAVQGQPEVDNAFCQRLNATDPTTWSCQCLPGHFSLEGKCWSPIYTDDIPCGRDEQCDMDDNQSCTTLTRSDKYCGCNDGFLDINLTSRINCEPYIHDEDTTCVDHRQCELGMGRANCTDAKQCRCIPPYQFHDGDEKHVKCFMAKGLGDECGMDGECAVGVGPNSECANNSICSCVPSAIGLDGHCYFPKGLGESCTLNGECTLGAGGAYSECRKVTEVRSICSCLPTTIDWEGHCYYPKVVGDHCQSHLECSVPIRGRVECDPRAKMCACEVDHVPDLGGTICRAAVCLQQ